MLARPPDISGLVCFYKQIYTKWFFRLDTNRYIQNGFFSFIAKKGVSLYVCVER